MPLLRLSVLNDQLYVPAEDGTLIDEAYDANPAHRYTGRLDWTSVDPAAPDTLTRHIRNVLPQVSLPPEAPLLVMVHGWMFDPAKKAGGSNRMSGNPHARLYHFKPDQPKLEHIWHNTPWPKRLGFEAEAVAGTGVVLAFAWRSEVPSGLLLGKNYRKTHLLAENAALILAATLRRLAEGAGAGRKIDLFCHSFGTIVVVKAMLELAQSHAAFVADRIGKVFLLGGAANSRDAESLLDRLPAWDGSGPEFFNMTCDRDWPVNHIARPFNPAGKGLGLIGVDGISQGPGHRRWLDVRLDRKEVQTWFAQRGYSVESNPPGPGMNHTYYYTHAGNTDVYADLLRARGRLAGGLGGMLEDGYPAPPGAPVIPVEGLAPRPYADLHCDVMLRDKVFRQDPLQDLSARRAPVTALLNLAGKLAAGSKGEALNLRAQTDFPRLQQAGASVVFAGIHSLFNYRNKEAAFKEMCGDLEELDTLCRRSGGFVQRPDSVKSWLEAPPFDGVCVLPGVEGAHMLQGPDFIRGDVKLLKERGVAYLTLVHLFSNWVGTSAYVPTLARALFPDPDEHQMKEPDRPLTKAGLELVRTMCRELVVPDFSHVNSVGLQQGCSVLREEFSHLPALVSHSLFRGTKGARMPRGKVQDTTAREKAFIDGHVFAFNKTDPEEWTLSPDTGAPAYLATLAANPADPAFRGLSKADVAAVVNTGRRGGLIGVLFAPMYLAPESERKTVTTAIIAQHIHDLRCFINTLPSRTGVGLAQGIDHVALGSDYDGCIDLPKDHVDCLNLPEVFKRLRENHDWTEEDLHKLALENVRRFYQEWVS